MVLFKSNRPLLRGWGKFVRHRLVHIRDTPVSTPNFEHASQSVAKAKDEARETAENQRYLPEKINA